MRMSERVQNYLIKMKEGVSSYPWTLQSVSFSILALFSIFFLIFGFQFILGFILALSALIIGVSLRFYHDYDEIGNNGQGAQKDYFDSMLGKEKISIPGRPPRNKLDMRITGSALIDETIHEMIDFILRDYVHSWHDSISKISPLPHDEFIYELRKTIQQALVTLSSRVKEVDWIPYLTTHLVDDAATHLRLYRQAVSKLKENSNGNSDLIPIFFNLEATMEKNLCRDMVSTDDSHLIDYFEGLSEVLLYLLLPQEAYNCSPIGILAQDLLVNHVFIPILNLVSDSDFVNTTLIWLCQDFSVTPEIFMSVLRTSSKIEELKAAQAFTTQHIADLKKALDSTNSNASDDLSSLKQQIKVSSYVSKAIKLQLSALENRKSNNLENEDDEGEEWTHYFMDPNRKIHSLPLGQVVKNSVALSYLLDYMGGVGGTHYLLLYLNADAWRASAELQLSEIEDQTKNSKISSGEIEKNHQEMLDCMRDAAFNIYDQFLSEKAVPRVKLGEGVVRKFYIQLRTEPITGHLFDQIQEAVLELIDSNDKFYPSFKKNKLYIKCLMELDLLKAESVSTPNSNSFEDDDDEDELVHIDEFPKFSSSPTSPDTETKTCRECLRSKNSHLSPSDLLKYEQSLWNNSKYSLSANLIEVALTVERGSPFGIYVILVVRRDEGQPENKWHIYRRYSDFHDFHNWIRGKWMRLSRVEFPSKTTFGKTDRTFLEKRMAQLNKYLATILQMTQEPCFGESLQDSLLHFLEPGNYVPRKKQLSDKIDSFVSESVVNPVKQSFKSVTHAVKTMPDTLLDSVSKILHSKNEDGELHEALKVGASLDTDSDDNVPLRIILLLLDEIFDLKSKNQWLRRRIVILFRQVVKTMMGDNLNRRIVDYVAYLTSPSRVSNYLRSLQHSLWPGGRKMEGGEARDQETKLRTKIAAKAALLSTLSDELKHVIGSETTRRGLLCVFDLLQNRILNKRLLLVLLEGLIKTLYPDKPFSSLIQRLHYRSNRIAKFRPFLIPNSSNSTLINNISNLNTKSSGKSSTLPIMTNNLSPRGGRKKNY